MEYSTALALKEAGFPQHPFKPSCRENNCWEQTSESEEVHIPTLSELIEELGDDFHNLHRWNGSYEDKWVCNFRTDNKTVTWDSSGPTMETAVANLYLSLHGKKD